jgi:anti-sigma factor RsiW
MTQTRFGEQACQKFRAKLDSYIDNELLTESNLEMIEHFKRCTSCTQEEQERRNVRRRLRDAVREVPVPAGLEGRIRDRLRQPQQPQPKKLFLMAIAAVLALCFGVFRLRDPGSALLRMAFDDHLHCAVIHHPTPRVPSEPNQLPERLTGLASLVQQHVPSEFSLKIAHECQDQGRSFVHLTFSDGQHLMSVMIARRANGESLGSGMRQAARDGLQLAAFESGEFFLYTVSDLSAPANTSVLAQISPAVEGFLSRVEG